MIIRIWHGWTSTDKADSYESLLINEIFVGIGNRKIDGYLGIQLLRRELENEVEFITIMKFDNINAVKLFAGEDYKKAVVPSKAQGLLSRYDKESQHYLLILEQNQD